MEVNLALFLVIFIAILLLLIFSGMPVAFALGGVGILSIYIWLGGAIPQQIAYVAYNAVTNFSLTCIPLFILMGAIFAYSGLSARVYTAISPLMCRLLPGGLLHSNVVGGAMFAAASGSSIASTTTIGLIALPEMEARGYERSISSGSVCAGGALGILIPPSITLIIYGAMCGVSVGKLFIAGIIPGIILTAAYMTYIGVRLGVQPHLAPPREPIPLKTCLIRSLSAWPVLVLVFCVIGSIYLGIATPTEAAAMGCAGAVALAAGFRSLSWEVVKKITWEAVRISGMLLLLFASARVMGLSIALLKVPEQIMAFVASLGLGRYFVLAGIYLMYIVMGMLMESLIAIVMTLPIVFPILITLGFDPIWGGIVIVMLDEMGLITPPVGVNLYVIQGLRPDYKFGEIAMGGLPFVLVIFSVLLVVTAFPQLATFLPQTMFRTR